MRTLLIPLALRLAALLAPLAAPLPAERFFEPPSLSGASLTPDGC